MDGLFPGEYIFEIIVYDGYGGTSHEFVYVTVNNVVSVVEALPYVGGGLAVVGIAVTLGIVASKKKKAKKATMSASDIKDATM